MSNINHAMLRREDMELLKHPETEIEYWEAIESIGGFVWRMNHDASHGRFEMTEKIEKDISDASQIMEMLVSELFVQFGVVHPKDCPRRNAEGKMPESPAGMSWYWDWYHKMKTEWNRAEYEKIICSACALCKGADAFIQGNTIPCTVWSGTLYQLYKPYQCAMLIDSNGPWKKEKLFTKIKKVGGKEAIDKFKAKEVELRAIM